MKQKLATPVLLFFSSVMTMNVGVGIYEHFFGIPAMLRSSESLRSFDGRSPLIPVFWIALHAMILISLILSLILNNRYPQRKRLLWYAFGGYIFVSLISIYFTRQLTAMANLPTDSAEYFSRSQQWLILSWFRVVILLACAVMGLSALSKQPVRQAA